MAKFAWKFCIRLTRRLSHRNFREKVRERAHSFYNFYYYKTTYKATCRYKHTRKYFARIVRRAMRVRRSRSWRLFTRSTVPLVLLVHACMHACVHACGVHACVQERVYIEVGVRSNGEKGVKEGTITVPRFRATTRRHPFDLHPPMPCSKPTQRYTPPILFLPSMPARTPDVRHVHFSTFLSFLPSTCRRAVTRTLAAKEEATLSESIVLLHRGREVGG